MPLSNLSNPIVKQAIELFNGAYKAHKGRGNKWLDLTTELENYKGQAIDMRAEDLQNYVGIIDENANEKRLTKIFDSLAKNNDFKDFQALFAIPCFGIVFTAHPTFAIHSRLMEIIAQLASNVDENGIKLSSSAKKKLLEEAKKSTHHSPLPITLDDEFALSEKAIQGARHALKQALRLLVKTAFSHYEKEKIAIKQDFTPLLLDLASWVGGDMDGRNDIGWNKSLSLRLLASAKQFTLLSRDLDALASWPDARQYANHIFALAKDLDEMGKKREALSRMLENCDAKNGDDIANFARALIASKDMQNESLNSTNSDYWMDRLNQVITLIDDDNGALVQELVVLKSLVKATKLSSAKLHMRLNATQIHNAMRQIIGLSGDPASPSWERTALRRLIEEFDHIQVRDVNFGNLMIEQSSARRMFMVVRQILHHLDENCEIRFLIAESESPFTVLGALYLAKYFGVDHLVDISPLFESGTALEHGADIIARLMEFPLYQDYVKQRGFVAVQTGFSDAGRAMGQVGASLAVERFQMKLAHVMGKAGLHDCKLILFNTHGESMGRGAHPSSLAERYSYIYSPMARQNFLENGIQVKPEASFQGGDGYVYFQTPALAFATITRIIETHIAGNHFEDDGFYMAQDQSLDFFISLQDYNRRLMENRDFGALLFGFGPNLLYPSGSRNLKRQSEGRNVNAYREAGQMRAIPQNAILQQLGWPATVTAGVGQAINRDADWFREQAPKSKRLSQLIDMVAHAHKSGNTEFLLAYLELYNPHFWLRLAKGLQIEEGEIANQDDENHDGEVTTHSGAARHIAHLLSDMQFYPKASRISFMMVQDALELGAILKENFAIQNGIDKERLELAEKLHAARIALIVELFLHIPRLPAFSSNPNAGVEDVMALALSLDIEAARDILFRAFPLSDETGQHDFGEIGASKDEIHDYALDRARLIDPMESLYERIREITLILSHLHNAFG